MHLLTHCHLLVPRRLLEASEFCPEVAGAGPCLSPASFKPHVVNTEPSTVPTAGTKQRKQTGFHLMELTFQWEMKHRSQNMQIAIMPVLLCARGREGGATESPNASVAA